MLIKNLMMMMKYSIAPDKVFFFLFFFNPKELIYEPGHDKTNKKTCVTNKDSDQPVHTPAIARFLVYPSLDSLEAVEGTCDQ